MSDLIPFAKLPPRFVPGDLLYRNPLASPSDVEAFVAEGQPTLEFPGTGMRLSNAMDPAKGQAANYLFWCPEVFPADIQVTWTFRPLQDPGLAMFWIAAAGRNGEDLFDPSLAPRAGQYRQYHSGDINAYHLSYFRRKNPDERYFRTCNLRKSHGFHLVCQGGDPIGNPEDVTEPYRMKVVKCGPRIALSIHDLPIFAWYDDGETFGPRLGGGRIGFRQMAPLVADYADLEVRAVRQAGA